MTVKETPVTDWKIWQDVDIVTNFAEERRRGIPGWRDQLEILCQLLPTLPIGRPARVLDLGCGDGILLDTVLRFWKTAEGYGVDGSEAMLDRARIRLEPLGKQVVKLVQADFNFPEWSDWLPPFKFDAIISGFAIHHSDDSRKQSLYGEIYALLKPDGVFINTEHVASATPFGETLFERAYAAQIVRSQQELGIEANFDQTLQDLQQRLDKSANQLTSVETQLQWLRDIGYHEVDCYWKHFELAILAGYRK